MGLSWPIPWKRCLLGPWILLTADRNPYAENPMLLSDLTCDDLERSFQGHVGLNGPIPWKRCMLGPWIVLTADRKPYSGNPMVVSDMIYGDLGRSYLGQAGLNQPIPWKWCVLGPWIVLTADRKPYTWNPMALSDLSYNHFESSGHAAWKFAGWATGPLALSFSKTYHSKNWKRLKQYNVFSLF